MMKNRILFDSLLLLIAIVILLTISCKKDEENTNTVTDIDGNVYHTVIIGSQTWMVENLKVTHYRNGKPILHVTESNDWINLKTGAYCNYDNITSYGMDYGKLYNWYAVNDTNNIAPTGWHVPSYAEWDTLIHFLGGSNVAGGKLKESGFAHWQNPNTGGTNSFGFTALPAGYRIFSGDFISLGSCAVWWSTSKLTDYSSLSLMINNNDCIAATSDKVFIDGLSVRCVKD